MIRFLCAALVTAFLASSTQAKTLAEISNERACVQDSDCVLIQGTCSPTAVNKDYKNNAEKYYKEQAKGARCVNKFWVPKDLIAECRPLAGSKASKDAPVVPHSTCQAVAKPKKE